MVFYLPKPDSSIVRLFSYPRKRPTLEPPQLLSETDSQIYPSVSPFDRLPIELQVEIFSHCFPPFPRFDVNEGPLLIGRVCSAWRTVLLSTPRFWSSFEIEVNGSGPSVSLRDIQIVSTMELWLRRSRTNPLNVRVIHIPVGRIPDPLSAQLVALLIPEARRWRHVQFIIPTANMASLRHSFPNEFPSLRSLTLQMKGLWTSEPTFTLSTAGIPWAQLTRLDLQLEQNNLPDLNDCLNILRQMDQVKECTLSANCTLNSDQGIEVNATYLESFHLLVHNGAESAADSLAHFLCLLSTPSLHSLDLKWHVNNATNWSTAHQDFTTFLRGISSTLRTLELSYLPVSEEDLLDCLSHIPFLEDLELRFSLNDDEQEPITSTFAAALTISPPNAVEMTNTDISPDAQLLPCLTSFMLECNGSRLSFTALVAMINSRHDYSDSSSPLLRRVHVRSMKPVIREIDWQVALWAGEGMDISIDTVPLL
ncbi:hypothetical protein CPB83DRAFT_850038 [Crepidotus variabilis]|uniref:F-box domain-containing protein n=1 Tax=Crepidotus variabilis TaxID=179855 RepID=A0A9P6JSQ6_9AGAR|nr:hypothetical protein CPB83DRAFT_850038 [Crepidotus variabilis]